MLLLTPTSVVLLIGLAILQSTQADLIAYGICQTTCNSAAAACYAAAGFMFGTMIAVHNVPPVVLACNTGLGTCSATCVVALLTPD
ncbi:hypothetical protein K435DRAFT_651135 [Dendrothele bispora CBS 962.96]|uniref:Cysteine-rich protein n=1 Tax=Dendrothele bispora (strain CBS 962.96) TaxID=1314807 RepID=A0A4S8MMI4_DENBC|nr:hypothetical protein K435DRAFT_651135 [Dendrothele bispora CBS 962.96]